MPEVLVLCEGQTERAFCNEVLKPYLANKSAGQLSLRGTLRGNPQNRKGGIKDWDVYLNELRLYKKQHPDWHIAVMVDYYALPDTWPGRSQAPAKSHEKRGLFIEEELIKNTANEFFNCFHPCIELHEFESLMFVEPETTALSCAVSLDLTEQQTSTVTDQLHEVSSEFQDHVERINDSKETSPSHRLESIIVGYRKAFHGPLIANDITVDVLRSKTPWLHRWLTRLEKLT